ncbi:MAG: hypothetical protein PVJ84_15920 [Desulfobacteraceae bacterium]
MKLIFLEMRRESFSDESDWGAWSDNDTDKLELLQRLWDSAPEPTPNSDPAHDLEPAPDTELTLDTELTPDTELAPDTEPAPDTQPTLDTDPPLDHGPAPEPYLTPEPGQALTAYVDNAFTGAEGYVAHAPFTNGTPVNLEPSKLNEPHERISL